MSFWPLYHSGKEPPVPAEQNLHGPQSRSACFEEDNDLLPLPGIEHNPSVFQRVACPLYRLS
jgi:hypothetical protein